ncbi:MAG TPA: peptidoglycan DD-metalloendopeptidase family protein [Gaiellaceae bacterium]
MRHLLRLTTLLLVALVLPAAASAYPWPFKPFHEQHPIRGFFGDPRTVYQDGLVENALGGPGFFSFHQGVDIAAPDGTPIYAVASGTAHYLGAATLFVNTGHRVTFQYFHIVPVVGEGQHVTVSRTVLGYVQAPYGHVHITEIDGIRVVNPLLPGHLTPYRDTTKPTVRAITVEDRLGVVQGPLCGRVEIDANAYDTPPVPVPGPFHGLPVAPAFVAWTLARRGHGVILRRTIADFLVGLPPNGKFWSVYAKGTYENSPRFGSEQYRSMPGRYLFLLARSLDTATLPNGEYAITVRARDVRGNTASTTRDVSILNDPGVVCAGSLPAASSAPAPPPPRDDALAPQP